IFYNTGIATYIWILSNRKGPERQGKVQLIDATAWFKPLRKNLGKKNCELGPDDIRRICDAFLNREENEQSKIFPNEAFGYWKVTVERPLRLKVDFSEGALRRFRKACAEAADGDLFDLVEGVAGKISPGPHSDFNRFIDEVAGAAKAKGVRMTAKRQKLLMAALGVKDPEAEPVIKKATKPKAGADREQEALHGSYHSVVNGKPMVVEYEPDTELRDTEQVPFLEEGGIEAFIRREVLPHAPDAWIDAGKTAIGYEISFTRHFYKPQPLRTLAEIEADIRALEKETDGLLDDVIGKRS
ncbi:MAG: N-6 DNA methylase, partial [Magnetococcales bacterium]|nr:N-6 DNA methylase [Magnetococcales bacterium]